MANREMWEALCQIELDETPDVEQIERARRRQKKQKRLSCLLVLTIPVFVFGFLLYEVKHTYFFFWGSRCREMEWRFCLKDADALSLQKYRFVWGGQSPSSHRLWIDEITDYEAFCREQLTGVQWSYTDADGNRQLSDTFSPDYAEKTPRLDEVKFGGKTYPVEKDFCYKKAGTEGYDVYYYDVLVVSLGEDEYGIVLC